MAAREGRAAMRLVEPVSLLGLSLGNVLLGLMEPGEGRRPRHRTRRFGAAEEGPALRLRMPDGRVEREPLLGGSGAGTSGRGRGLRVTRRDGKAVACKLYRIGEGRALYAGVLKAAGARRSSSSRLRHEVSVPKPRRRRARCSSSACRVGGSSASCCSAASGAGTSRAGSRPLAS